MRVATIANLRTTAAARSSLPPALEIAFRGGSVMGMCVAGLGVPGMRVLVLAYDTFFVASGMWTLPRILQVLSGFSLRASSIALFARVGGGIDTKAAVVGDTVGDPFEDTAGPSLDILIKLMSVISRVLDPLLP